jgi:hypothetical protein
MKIHSHASNSLFRFFITMVAGGKPLWYLQIFTTGGALILTVFFLSLCLSWASGLNAPARPPKYPQEEWDHLLREGVAPFRESLASYMLWFNLGMGLVISVAGAAFGYLLYREKTTLLYSQIWFGVVSAFTLMWMVTSIIFYVKTEELAGNILSDQRQFLIGSLQSVYNWGKTRSSATSIGMVVFPTCLYLFLSYVAYRLSVKIEIYGNDNPERVSRSLAPGSWVERKAAADGGTWDREETQPLVKVQGGSVAGAVLVESGSGLAKDDGETPAPVATLEEVQQAVLQEDVKEDNVTAGWGSWLEDVFDYTF